MTASATPPTRASAHAGGGCSTGGSPRRSSCSVPRTSTRSAPRSPRTTTRAGLASKAIEWFERAAAVADRVSANVEGVRYLTRAVELIGQLPPSLERDRDELRLQLELASPTVASRGYATGDFAVALDRARILAATVHDRRSEVLALNGLTAAQIVHGEVRRSLETGRASVALVDDYPELVTACEMSYAGSMTALGMHDDAVDHFERAVRAYLPGRSMMAIGFDPGAFAMSWESHALWLSGAPGRAVERHREAMELAATCGPHSLALANAYGALLYFFLRDEDAMVGAGAGGHGPVRALRIRVLRRVGPDPAGLARSQRPGLERRRRGSRRRWRASARSAPNTAGRSTWRSSPRRTGRPVTSIARRSILGAALVTALANEDVSWLPEIHRLIAELGPASGREGDAQDRARPGPQPRQPFARAPGGDQPRPPHRTRPRTSCATSSMACPTGERSAEAIEALDLLERSAAV